MGTIRRGQGVTSASSYMYNHFDVFFSPFLGSAWFTVSQLYTSSQMWLAEVVREQNWLVGYLGGFGPWTPLRSKLIPWLDLIRCRSGWPGRVVGGPKCQWRLQSHLLLRVCPWAPCQTASDSCICHQGGKWHWSLHSGRLKEELWTIRNQSCWNAKVLLYIFFTNLVLHDLCSGLCDKTWQYVANICKSLFRIMDIDPVTLSSAAHIFLAKVVSACWVSAPSLLIKAGTVSKQERLKLTPTEAFNLLYFSIFQSRICLAKVTCPALRTAPNSSMLKKSAFSLQ